MSARVYLDRYAIPAIMLGIVLGSGMFFLVGAESAVRRAVEGDLIQTLTLLAYTLLLVMLVRLASLTRTDLAPIAAVVGLMLCRELDLHLGLDWLGLIHEDGFTFRPDFSAGALDAAMSVTITIAVAGLAWVLLTSHLRPTLRSVLAGETWARLVGLGLGLLVLSKLLDDGYRFLPVAGAEEGWTLRQLSLYLEEGLELAAPSAFVLAALSRIAALSEREAGLGGRRPAPFP